MKRLSNLFLQFLLNSNLIISLAAVSLSLATQVLIGAGPRLQPCLLLIFGACMTEYNLHRLMKYYVLPGHDRKLPFNRLSENLKFTRSITFLSLLILAVSFVFLAPHSKWVFSISAMITLLYSIPSEGLAGKLSLRKVPFLKTFLVAVVWAIITVLIPFTESYTSVAKETIAWIFAGRFLLIFSLALLFDMRDIETDEENGIQTIPVALGQKRTLQVVTALVVLFVFTTLIYSGLIGFNFHLISALLFAYYMLLVVKSPRARSSSYYYPLYLDGSLIVYSLPVIIGWLIFV